MPEQPPTNPTSARAADTRLSRLSYAALRDASALELRDAETLAERLYGYNSIPLTAEWEARLPTGAAVENWLLQNASDAQRALLDEYWVRRPAKSTPGWLMWSRRDRDQQLGGAGLRFKLYVSPAIEALRRTFGALLEVLPFCRAATFKVGADAAGLLRPDKIVAYFADLGDLTSAAHRLTSRLEGLPAQGVPFTAEISGGGLLSWSIDPPAHLGGRGVRTPSWREWVSDRLAAAILEARSDRGVRHPPWSAALERLRQEQVDVERWLPTAATWAASEE